MTDYDKRDDLLARQLARLPGHRATPWWVVALGTLLVLLGACAAYVGSPEAAGCVQVAPEVGDAEGRCNCPVCYERRGGDGEDPAQAEED